jgi:acetyltransferase-like isoleucine patch superfamily enzyme
MNTLSQILRKVIHLMGNFLRYLQTSYLRLTGVKIGKNTMISLRAKIDVRRGKVVIGDNCHITYGCVILSHDGSARQINPNNDGEGSVVIGNNVFVGVNSVILPNVTIGDSSVIGAGSVVTKDIPPGVVAVGNPARVIQQIEFLEKK